MSEISSAFRVFDMTDAMLKFLAGVLVIAIIAVIVSKNSNAANVVQSIASSFTNILGTVVKPVSSGAVSNGSTSTATTANGSQSATAGQSTTVTTGQ